jgi:hypothetical protein
MRVSVCRSDQSRRFDGRAGRVATVSRTPPKSPPAHAGPRFGTAPGTRAAAIGADRSGTVPNRRVALGGARPGSCRRESDAMETAGGTGKARTAHVEDGTGRPPTAVTRINVVPSPRSRRSYVSHGCRYDVYLEDGERLLSKVNEPVYRACRALASRGVSGRLEVWRPGAGHADMIVRNITKGAERTIEETAKVGPRLRKRRPMTADAFSSRRRNTTRSDARLDENAGSAGPDRARRGHTQGSE